MRIDATSRDGCAGKVLRIPLAVYGAVGVSFLILIRMSFIIAIGGGGFIAVFTTSPQMLSIGRTMLLLLCLVRGYSVCRAYRG